MGVGPLIAWHRAEPKRVCGQGIRPALFATLLIVAGLWMLGIHRPLALAGFSSSIFALLLTLQEIVRGVRARQRSGDGVFAALTTLFARNRRRYGGYVVHIGISLFALGAVGSTIYQAEIDRSLSTGESMQIGSYELRYTGLEERSMGDRVGSIATLEVFQDGEFMRRLEPRRELIRPKMDQPITIPAVWSRPGEDLYVLMGGFDPASEQVSLKAYINPLISLVWFGMLVLVAGTLIAAWPDAAETRALEAELKRLVPVCASARPDADGRLVRVRLNLGRVPIAGLLALSIVAVLAMCSIYAPLAFAQGEDVSSAQPEPDFESNSDLPPGVAYEDVSAIAKSLNCPLCQGYNLQDCPLQICFQLRGRIADELADGQSADQIRAGFVEDYGQQVLNAPRAKGFQPWHGGCPCWF